MSSCPFHAPSCFVFFLFILWLCLTYIFMSPFKVKQTGWEKAGAGIEKSQESRNWTQCKQVIASRDAVCDPSARLTGRERPSSSHRRHGCSVSPTLQYIMCCPMLCCSSSLCVCVCSHAFVCVPLRPSRKKSPHFLLFHKQDGLSPLHPHDSH